MRFLKATISVMLAAMLAVSSSAVFSAAKKQSVPVKLKTLKIFNEQSYTLKKAPKRTYKCLIKYNSNKTIKVTSKNYGASFLLKVFAMKETSGKKPVVKVYYKGSDGKNHTVKNLRFCVKPVAPIKFTDIYLNNKTTKEKVMFIPFDREYKFTYSRKGAVKIVPELYYGNRCRYSVTALKEGVTKVTVSINKTKIGSFNVTSGDYPTVLPKAYRDFNLYYNENGSSTYMQAGHVDISDVLLDKKANTKYYVTVADESVASVINGNLLYATGVGRTTAEVFEQIGNGEKTKIADIKLGVKKISMAYVARQNKLFYEDGIFGHGDFTEFLDLKHTKKLSMAPVIKESLLNNPYTGSSFSSKDYKITYKSSNKSVAAVSSKGVVTAKKVGNATIRYTITFSDKTEYTDKCAIVVEKE